MSKSEKGTPQCDIATHFAPECVWIVRVAGINFIAAFVNEMDTACAFEHDESVVRVCTCVVTCALDTCFDVLAELCTPERTESEARVPCYLSSPLPDVCVDMRVDMRVDLRVDMRVGTHVGTRVGMRVGMCGP